MKKTSRIIAFVLALLMVLMVFAFVACDDETDKDDDGDDNNTENGGTENGGTENGGTENGGTENGGTENGGTGNGGTGNGGTGNGGTTQLQTITGVSFAGATHSYDGQQKEITVSGTLPAGVSVAYTNNKGTDAGTYNATAVLSGEGYQTLTLNATLKINKISFGTITFNGGSFEYDEQNHSITVTGNIPGDATVTYSGGEDGRNGATNVGEYTINVTVAHKNYNTYTGSAVLKITSKVEPLSVSFFNGDIYFQNSLDKNYMYSYDGSEIARVSRDNPVSMITVGSKMYYISKGILSSGIYSYNPTTGKTECLAEVSANSLISDGTYLYYNVNSLLNSENNGIYRIKISDIENGDNDVVAGKVTSVKSDSMTVTDGYIYFANKNDGGKLYAVSASASNATPVKVYDYKVSELINDGEKIYFVRHKLTGNCIYSINVDGGLHTLVDDESNKVVKITMSNGKYLTLIGDYVYFLNTDMVTSNIFGDGIYKAKKDGSGWVGDALNLLVGATKVVDGTNDNIFGLATDGDALYYYRASTKHLYQYDISSQSETDLMNGFVPPVYQQAITTYYEKAQVYNGEIYYINMLDGGKLYRYNPTTQSDIRITNLTVADFAIYDGVLYYSTVRLMVNFDLYRMNLVTGEPEVISTEKCKNFLVTNGKLYYNNFSGSNTLNSIDLETLAITVVFDDESVDDYDLTLYDGKLYFVADGRLYSYSFANQTAAVVNNNLKPNEYIIYNGTILMMNDGLTKNSMTVYDIATDTVTDLGSIGLTGDLRGMFVYNGQIYCYRNNLLGNDAEDAGLYKIVKNGTQYTAQLVDAVDGYYMCESMVIGNKVYFMDVWQIKDSVPTTSSSAKICVRDMITGDITVLN